MKYIDNPEIKVYAWYPFIKSSIEDLIDKMKKLSEIEIEFIDKKEGAIEMVNNKEVAFG
ncbi:MAG: hypothetical protein J7L07_07855 [Candidatus Odinarchaeota archaeon]|nr:hypothetical protein [Candidatus Odinarchaeota archaeon]